MAEQPEKKICLKCHHVNPDTATVCEKCGTPLKPTTVPVPDIKNELAEQAEKPVTKSKTDELVKQIALWVRNEPKPVLVDIGRGHVLGRRTSASDPPDLVDLTEYGAYRLGVSRRHAQFECTEDGCIVIDLGSSNGTWVNGLRLEPYQPAHVKSGDRINLGRMEFSIGYALSDAPPTAPPPESKVATAPHLTSPSGTDDKPEKAEEPESKAPASEAAKPAASGPAVTDEVDQKPTESAPPMTDASEIPDAPKTLDVSDPKATNEHDAVPKAAAESPAVPKPDDIKPPAPKPSGDKAPESKPEDVKPPDNNKKPPESSA